MKLTIKINNDKFTEFIYQNYDIQNRDFVDFEIPYFNFPAEPFNIGLICGNSGSGKSLLLNNIGNPQRAVFDKEKPLISNFPNLSEQEACKLLASVGLGSVPNWLKPYHILSNGEKFRAEIAYKINYSDGLILIDEFTSVVDRVVAKAVSNSVQKYLRRINKQAIFASCHNDIIEWLQPDWVYYTETQKLIKKNSIHDLESNYKYSGATIIRGTYSRNIII